MMRHFASGEVFFPSTTGGCRSTEIPHFAFISFPSDVEPTDSFNLPGKPLSGGDFGALQLLDRSGGLSSLELTTEAKQIDSGLAPPLIPGRTPIGAV
jgi:hypothetical protein